MYCKECGNEIQEDSKFCSNCGTQIVSESSKNENESEIQDKKAIRGFIIAAIVVSFIVLSIKAFDVATGMEISDAFQLVFSNKATPSDINVEYTIIPSGLTDASVMAVFQANEKIRNLEVRVYLLDSNRETIKTEDIHLGNLTPGNEYKEYISLSEFGLSDIERIKYFRLEIIDGKIAR